MFLFPPSHYVKKQAPSMKKSRSPHITISYNGKKSCKEKMTMKMFQKRLLTYLSRSLLSDMVTRAPVYIDVRDEAKGRRNKCKLCKDWMFMRKYRINFFQKKFRLDERWGVQNDSVMWKKWKVSNISYRVANLLNCGSPSPNDTARILQRQIQSERENKQSKQRSLRRNKAN